MFTAVFTAALVLGQPVPEAESVRATDAALRDLTPAASAFRRGLLPFADYVVHVESVATGMDENAGMAFREIVFRDAERRLAAFDQPAAIGWASDLAEARYLLALSRGVGVDELDRLANRAIRLRTADLRIGHVSDVGLAETIGRVAPQGDNVAAVERRLDMDRAVRGYYAEQVRLGVGRSDELAIARIRSGRVVGAEAVAMADRALADAVRYAALGTASLYDVARAFAVAGEVHESLPEDQQFADADAIQTRRRQLESVILAIRDRRGRNEADVQLALRLLDEGGRVRAMRPVDYDDSEAKMDQTTPEPVDPQSTEPLQPESTEPVEPKTTEPISETSAP